MIKRYIELPKNVKETFFLLGPRQTGKSYLLKTSYPKAKYINLLKTDIYLKYLESPFLLREEILEQKDELILPVILDEVQKVPLLLDEVHYLIENENISFALCGSSARKLKKQKANLLGGRGKRFEFYGFSAIELAETFDLTKILNRGYLPNHYLSNDYYDLINSYVNNYLKEEILDEGLSRNIPIFSNFLFNAALSDTELINHANIARDCGVSLPTVKEYFNILIDTMLGRFLPAYIRRPKRRVIQAPKFYFFDIGVVNFLTKRFQILPKSEYYGKAFENWVFHELNVFNSYKRKFFDYSYWKLASGTEVDFIVNDMEYAIEVKAKEKIQSHDLTGLREVIKEHPKIKKRFLICLEKENRITEDKIHIINYNSFIKKLWNDSLFT